MAIIIKFFGREEFQEKSKIFMWLLENNTVLTKDNLIKKKSGQETPNAISVTMRKQESISHLFFSCPISNVVWAVVAQVIGASDIPDLKSMLLMD